jgi:hypothetical protein
MKRASSSSPPEQRSPRRIEPCIEIGSAVLDELGNGTIDEFPLRAGKHRGGEAHTLHSDGFHGSDSYRKARFDRVKSSHSKRNAGTPYGIRTRSNRIPGESWCRINDLLAGSSVI